MEQDAGFRNFVGYLSLVDFEIASSQVWLSYSFLYQIFLLQVDQKKEYWKKIVGKVVENMTRGSCIPTDSGENDVYFIFFHNIRTKAYVDSDKINLAYLVG